MIELIKQKLTNFDNDPCYLVSGEKIYSKYLANKKAQSLCKTNDPNELWSYIKFENYVTHKGEEPKESLRELYKKRAVQIRDENKFVRIWASGGADSTCVLHAFREAGVVPDEIATYMQYPGAIHASQNAEVDFSLRPLLKDVRKWWPGVKIKFYDILPEHYAWYAEHAIEHWVSYTQLQPAACGWQIPYEIYPELLEQSMTQQTTNIYSGPDFTIGLDSKGWYYKFIDPSYNHAFNAPFQQHFFADPSCKELMLKMAYTAKQHISSKATDDTQKVEDQLRGEWDIKSGALKEMDFWLPYNVEFGTKKNKKNWIGVLNRGPKASLRMHNMISSESGQTTLMNILYFYKKMNIQNPHWFTNGNVMLDWIGSATNKVYFDPKGF